MASDAPRPTLRLISGLFLATTLFGLAAAGCSGGNKLSASGTSGELPDSEVEDFAITETDSGRTQWTLFAKKAATFTARDLVTARTVRIDFFGADGRKSSELVARGQVVLQTTEGYRMSTEELTFSNSRNLILSDRLVRVEKEGSVLEGVGFKSDPNLEHFEFREQVRATVLPGATRASTRPRGDGR